MKTIIAAGLVALTMTGAAAANEPRDGATLDFGVDDARTANVGPTAAAWIGRYGQVCYHGPVWIAACHASDAPGAYIPGHWNPMRTRWIPGHYS